MANAVFNSLENYFTKKKLRPNLDWSKFALDNIKSMTMDYGILYPIYAEDCVPGDKLKISLKSKIQALPLRNPIFNQIKVYTYFYYVPYYMLWHHFDRFIEGGRDGTYTAEIPYVKTTKDGSASMEFSKSERYLGGNGIFGHNTLWDYMEMEPITPETTLPATDPSEVEATDLELNKEIKVNAFKFAAYQRIYRDEFMNQDVQTETNINRWFPEDDFDFQLKDGENHLMGENADDRGIDYGNMNEEFADTYEDLPMLLALRARNWNKDYFTSMWFSPQRGPAQAVNTYNQVTSTIDFTPSIADNGTTPETWAPIITGGEGDPLENKIGALSGAVTGYKNHLAQALNKAKITTTATGGFTLQDLHTAQQIQIWYERNMAVKAQYNEFLRIHFDDAPIDERLTKPQYIGGTVDTIQVSEILQQSQTTETSEQGTATGHATQYGGQYVGKCYSHEFGLVLGLACIMPEAYYCHGISRHDTKESRFDFYFPEFANLEPQAVLAKEYVARQAYSPINPEPETWLEQPIGYAGRYDEYRFHKSMAVGDLRDERKTDFSAWLIKKEMGEKENGLVGFKKPVLGQRMISTHARKTIWTSPAKTIAVNELSDKYNEFYQSLIDHSAWTSNKTVNPFIAQFGISVEAVRPMPFISDPTKANER